MHDQRPRPQDARRSFSVDSLDKVRGQYENETYEKAVQKRHVWVLPLFVAAKQWQGLRRLRPRGSRNANIQGLVNEAGQNLKRFLAATG
jgi:hypothetical protein